MPSDEDGPGDLEMLWEVVREGDRASIEALLVGVCAAPLRRFFMMLLPPLHCCLFYFVLTLLLFALSAGR